MTGVTYTSLSIGKDGPNILNGTGIPNSSIGINGDVYVRKDTTDIYRKISGTWSPVSSSGSVVGSESFATNVSVGNLVYYNSTTKQYELADALIGCNGVRGINNNVLSFSDVFDTGTTTLSVGTVYYVGSSVNNEQGGYTTNDTGLILGTAITTSSIILEVGLPFAVTSELVNTNRSKVMNPQNTFQAIDLYMIQEFMNKANLWESSRRMPNTLTSVNGVVDVDFNNTNYYLTTTENSIFANPSNTILTNNVGKRGIITVKQESTPYTVDFKNKWTVADGVDITHTSNAKDLIDYYINNDNQIDCNIIKNVIARSAIITVNHAPTITSPSSILTSEDTPYTLSNVSFDDSLDTQELVASTVTLSCTHGTFTVTDSNVTITNNGTSNVTVTGMIAQLNTAMGNTVYTPVLNYNGNDSLSVSINDNNNGGGVSAQITSTNIDITISAVWDGSSWGLTAINTNVNTPVIVDTFINQIVKNVSTEVWKWEFTVPTTSITIGGTRVGDVWVVLDSELSTSSITFTEAVPTQAGLLLNFYDDTELYLSNNWHFTVLSNVTYTNHAPILSAPSSFTMNEDTVYNFSNISISDSEDLHEIANTTITFTCSNGTLISNSTDGTHTITLSGAGTSTFSMIGRIVDLNALLTTLTYTPTSNYNGSDTISISVSDGGNGSETAGTNVLTTSGSIDVTISNVLDAPVLTVSDIYVTPNTTTPFPITVTDIDSSAVLTVEISGLGTTYTLNYGTYNSGTDVWSLSYADLTGLTVTSPVTEGTISPVITAFATLGVDVASSSNSITIYNASILTVDNNTLILAPLTTSNQYLVDSSLRNRLFTMSQPLSTDHVFNSTKSINGECTIRKRISNPDRFNFENGYTIEFWHNYEAPTTTFNPNTYQLIKLTSDDTSYIKLSCVSGDMRWDFYDTVIGIQSGQVGSAMSVGWHHIALVYVGTINIGNDCVLYIDGTSVATIPIARSPSNYNSYIEVGEINTSNSIYIDGIRITNGIRYTTTFTPPVDLTIYDEFTYQTVLLLDAEQQAAGRNIEDHSPEPLRINNMVSINQLVLIPNTNGNTECIHLGQNHNIQITNNIADFNLTTFTLDFYTRIINNVFYNGYIHIGTTATDGTEWFVEVQPNYIYIYTGTQTFLYPTIQFADMNWHHIAFSSDGSNLYLFVDGKLLSTYSITSADFVNPSYGLQIYKSGGYHGSNELGELRLSNVCRYTSDFTIPTSSDYLSANDTQWASVLLLTGAGNVTSTTWTDATSRHSITGTGFVVSPINSVIAPTSRIKTLNIIGGTDITSFWDYQHIFSSTSKNYYDESFMFGLVNGREYTLEFNVYIPSGTGSCYILYQGSVQCLNIQFDGTNLVLTSNGGIPITTDVWHHVAVTGGVNENVWIDGILVSSMAKNGNAYVDGESLTIGHPWIYMDNVRFTYDVNRYTSTFTPPTTLGTNVTDDIYYNKVNLLLTDLQDSVKYVSESNINSHDVILQGTSTIDTNITKFGTGSLLLANPTDGITDAWAIIPVTKNDNHTFSLHNTWTIEMWVYPLTIKNCTVLSVSPDWSIKLSNSELVLDAEESQYALSIYPNINEWTHIAVTYDGTILRWFMNGALSISLVDTIGTITTTNNLVIGCSLDNTSVDAFNGHIEGLRITSSCLYTTTFTPPTTSNYGYV